MSGPNAPFGFKPVKTLNGGDLRIGRYTVSSLSARIFRGDLVKLLTSTGLVSRSASNSTNILGVAARDTGVIAGQVTDFPVYDDPSTVYQAQFSNTSAITQAYMGGNYRIVATTGDTSTGRSKMAVKSAASVSSSSYMIKAIRTVSDGSNDLALYTVIECLVQGDPTKLGRALV